MQKVHVLGLDVVASRGAWPASENSRELRVYVPYTTSHLTRVALIAVAALTRNLGARVSLVAVQVVPFPSPLDSPGVAASFFGEQLKTIARDIDLELDAQVVIARDCEVAFDRALSPGSLVVLATKKRWWPTRQAKLARLLARAGHNVTLLQI